MNDGHRHGIFKYGNVDATLLSLLWLNPMVDGSSMPKPLDGSSFAML